jgi:uncharacterized integral membrane protein (TIGR00698 family)
MVFQQKQVNAIYLVVCFLCFLPIVSPAIGLIIGILFSMMGIKHEQASKYTTYLLQASIVLMGFGMNLTQVFSAAKTGFWSTTISVTLVMVAGFILAKIFKIESKIGLLLSSGTAICGASAIAAIAPVINAKGHQISFSLVVVFVLNAVALILFPIVGHLLHLNQEAFGYWAAIAIHDTSSVIGAGASYGPEALEVATTVKLIRTLWIVPLTFVLALTQNDRSIGKMKIPWFIALFVSSIVMAYFIPQWNNTFDHFYWLGRKGMVLALFLIGTSISVSEARETGTKSFFYGLALWALISVVSLVALSVRF